MVAATVLDLWPSTTTFPGTGGITASPFGATVVINGLYTSGVDSNGVTWHTGSIAGWDGSSSSSIQLTQKTRAPGAWTSPRNMTPRVMTVSGTIVGPSIDATASAIDQLNAASGLTSFVVTVARGSLIRSVIAYRHGVVDFTEVNEVTFQWTMDLVAADPRKFATALSTTTHLPSASGGLTIPVKVPFAINSTVVSGNCFLTNAGNAVGPVVLTLQGPLTAPQVTHVSTGLTLTFGSSMTLASTDFLVVDMEAQTAMANGQASRNAYITSRGWSGFDPGVNQWAFSAQAGSGTCTVAATPAWL